MKIKFWLIFISLNQIIINSQAFLPPRILITKCPNRLFGLQLKLLKRKSNQEFKNRLEIIRKNQNEIVDQSVSVVSDNIVQDFIYVLKFYNLSDDSSSSFIYIIFYETLWLGFRIFKISIRDNDFDPESEESQLLFQQLYFNIILYIVIKNIIFNKFVGMIHH